MTLEEKIKVHLTLDEAIINSEDPGFYQPIEKTIYGVGERTTKELFDYMTQGPDDMNSSKYSPEQQETADRAIQCYDHAVDPAIKYLSRDTGFDEVASFNKRLKDISDIVLDSAQTESYEEIDVTKNIEKEIRLIAYQATPGGK